VSFSPLGDYLASGSSDRTVRVWPLKEKKEPLVLRGHKGAIRSIAFSPDGATIASGSEDMMIKIWGIAEAKEILQIGPTSDMVGGIAFSPRGSMIISGSWNGSTQVWDAQTGKQRANLNGHSDAVVAVAVSSDAQSLVTASMDKTIRLWPATAPPPAAQLTFVGHTAALWSVAVSPDRKTLATAGKDGAIRLWDAATTKFIGRLAGHQSGVTHLSFSSDGKTLLSAGKDKLARIWDVEKREEKLALTHHTGEVTRAIFSPNGQVIATASTDKVVRLFDPTTGKLIRELPAHDATVSALAFNKDGSQLASGGNDKVMILWNVATGAIVQRTPVNFNLGQIHAVAFTPDGKNIALAHNQDYRQPMDDDQGDPQWRNVAMWNLEKGAFIESVAQYQHSDWITAIGFSAGGDMMITTSRDGMVRFWELATHKLHQSFRAHQANIAALAVSSDGEALFTAGDDRLARRWSAIPRMPLTERARITGQTGRVRFSVLSPDGKLVATGGDDKAIRLRSTSLGAHVVMQSQAGAAYCVTFSPDNKYVVSGHEHGQVRVSDPVTGKEIKRLDAKDQRVWGLAFSKDGKYLVGVTGNWSDKEAGGVLVWTVADWKLQHTLAGHSDLVFSVSFSPDGRRFATGSRDNTVRIWDAVDGSCLRTLDLHKGAVRSVAWSGDNATLASVGFDNHLILWDTTTWKVRVDREYQGKGLCRVAFSPNSKILAIGYNTSDARIGHVILCDAVTNAEQHTLNGHTGQLLDLAFAANGQYIVTTGGRYGAQIENSPNDNAPARTLDDEDVVERPQAGAARIGKQAEIKCWNVQSGGKLVDLAGPQFWVEGVALSRDGHHIATAGGNEGKPGEVRVWETTGIQLKVALKGHEASASSAAFNPDGTLMATGGADKVVIIWDLKKALTLGGWGPEGVIKHTLRGHVMGVQKVRFTPDGKWVVSAGEDGVVKIWNVETGELARTISAHSMTINSLAMSPDGKTLATTANDWKNRKPSEIRFWDFDTGNEKFRLPDQRANVQDIAFSHDGKKFITAEQGENQVQIWDLTAQRVIKKLQASAPARCIAVTKDGRHLAVGTARGQVQVWDTTTWEELSVLKGHAQNRNGLDVNFAHDGSILVSAGGDATAGIWNMPMNRK
jgi:WD40 repeat protein